MPSSQQRDENLRKYRAQQCCAQQVQPPSLGRHASIAIHGKDPIGSGLRTAPCKLFQFLQICPHATTERRLQSRPTAAPAAAPTTVGLSASPTPNPTPAHARDVAAPHAIEQLFDERSRACRSADSSWLAAGNSTAVGASLADTESCGFGQRLGSSTSYEARGSQDEPGRIGMVMRHLFFPSDRTRRPLRRIAPTRRKR